MPSPETTLAPLKPPSRGLRRRWLLAILLALAVAFYLFQPLLFAWIVRRKMVAAGREAHLQVTPGRVEADFFGGRITLGDTLVASTDQAPSQISQVKAGTLELRFSPWRVLFQQEKPPVQELRLQNLDVRWVIRSKEETPSLQAGKVWQHWFPAAIVGSEIGGSIEWPGGRTEAQGIEFDFHPGAAGAIVLPKWGVKTSRGERSFTNLKGVTAIKGRALYIGGVKITDTIRLERGALDFEDLANAKITSDTQFTAFGGQVRTDAVADLRKSPALIDVSTSFWNLSVEQIGAFAGNPVLASGTIHEGRFTSRGHVAEPERATTTLRLNATDFHWHERQWQSLVISAMLVNRRLDILQFSLVQDKNQIELNGGIGLPDNWKKLPAQFQLNIQAQLDDLATAASLLQPGQKVVAGEAFFSGTVGSKDGEFSGKLKMRGGPMTISGVPIDRVRGDLDLRGTEVNVSNLELAHRDDLAKGWLSFDLGSQRRYSGQFEVNAGNMADYQAILPPAISGRAASGGVKLWWSGDGSETAHSGAFQVTLKDFVASNNPDAVPLNVETHGSYSPGGITMNHLHLARPATSLDALVVVRPDSLEVRDLKVAGQAGSSLTGTISLPLNVLSALKNPTLSALLDSKAEVAGTLTGQKLRLEDLLELSGRRWPMRGRTTFDLTTSGTLEELSAAGNLVLEDFSLSGGQEYRLPQANLTLKTWPGRAWLGGQWVAAPGGTINGWLEAGLALNRVTIVQREIFDPEAPISGSLTLKNLPLAALHAWVPPSAAWTGSVDGALTLSGSIESLAWNGKLNLNNASWQTDFLPQPLRRLTGALELAGQEVRYGDLAGEYRGGKFSVQGSSGFSALDDLKLEIQASDLPLEESDGWQARMDGDLLLSGPAASRSLTGSVLLKKAQADCDLQVLPVTETEALPPLPFTLPWIQDDWQIGLRVRSEGPVVVSDSWNLTPDLQISGTPAEPILRGTLAVKGGVFDGVCNFLGTPMEEGRLTFYVAESNGEPSQASNEDALWINAPLPAPETWRLEWRPTGN